LEISVAVELLEGRARGRCGKGAAGRLVILIVYPTAELVVRSTPFLRALSEITCAYRHMKICTEQVEKGVI
jgi:hypothetical protein